MERERWRERDREMEGWRERDGERNGGMERERWRDGDRDGEKSKLHELYTVFMYISYYKVMTLHAGSPCPPAVRGPWWELS